ncbi:MAG: glycosyltransferase family 2 protein [Methanoregulaceae archaeon]
MYDLTVIIPTYKEESNIDAVIREVDAVFTQNAINGEILVVDDSSPDRTAEIVQDLRKVKPNLNLIVRDKDPGLSQSVVEGFRRAQSGIFLVMDADLSHPPDLLPKMLEEIRTGNDLVIGSRYMEGGKIGEWPLKRKIISKGATFLGRLLFPEVHDPVSGFFAVRKSVVENAELRPSGYKILLEVLGKGSWEKEKEIPMEFVDRVTGSSKLKIRTILEYLGQVANIVVYSRSHHESKVWHEWLKLVKFGCVGATGILVNMGMLFVLSEFFNIYYLFSSAIAIELSIITNFILNDFWTFKDEKSRKLPHRTHRLLSYNLVSIGGMAINMGSLVFFTEVVGINYLVSNLIGIFIAFSWNFVVNRKTTWCL